MKPLEKQPDTQRMFSPEKHGLLTRDWGYPLWRWWTSSDQQSCRFGGSPCARQLERDLGVLDRARPWFNKNRTACGPLMAPSGPACTSYFSYILNIILIKQVGVSENGVYHKMARWIRKSLIDYQFVESMFRQTQYDVLFYWFYPHFPACLAECIRIVGLAHQVVLGCTSPL